MKRILCLILSCVLIAILTGALSGCGQDIKAENEKLKAENATLKSSVEKSNAEIQSMKDQLQKSSEKDAAISALTAENENLKKQLEDVKGKTSKSPRKK
jgi:predicted RNase H-like nuclease (RuvC/YqgF family)